MTANSFARVSFKLFGVLLVVECFVNLGDALSAVPLVYAPRASDMNSLLVHAGFSLGVRVLAALLFNVLPGALFLYYGRFWADRLAPPSTETSSYIEFTALLAVGLTLLGCYFVIRGLAGTVGGLFSVTFSDDYMRDYLWKSLASSLATLVAGVVTLVVARRAG